MAYAYYGQGKRQLLRIDIQEVHHASLPVAEHNPNCQKLPIWAKGERTFIILS